MSSAQVGLGTLTFGAVFTGIFDAETGFTYDGYSVPEVDTSTDVDVITTWCAGDTPDSGQFSGSIQIPDGTGIDAVVGTTEILTSTFPGGDTLTGNAFLVSAPTTFAKNGKVLAACTFRWEGAVVYAAGV